MLEFFAKLRRDDSGAAVIELAMVVPILIGLVVGIVDLSNAYSRKLQLEQAAQRTIENARQTLVGPDSIERLRHEAAATAGVAVDNVAADLWLECGGVRQSVGASICATGSLTARFITVDVRDQYKPMFPYRFAGSAADGSYSLHGVSGLRLQ